MNKLRIGGARLSQLAVGLLDGRTPLLLGCALLALFVLLTVLVVAGNPLALDMPITLELQEPRGLSPGWLLTAVSLPGYTPWAYLLPLLPVVALLLVGRRAAGGLVLAAGLASGVGLLLKVLVARPRPGADLVHVLQELGSYSSPSGHATEYTLLFGAIYYVGWCELSTSWLRTALMAASAMMIVLVGPSRIWLGEHWASDVLGGYLLGAGLLLLLIWTYRRWSTRGGMGNSAASEA